VGTLPQVEKSIPRQVDTQTKPDPQARPDTAAMPGVRVKPHTSMPDTPVRLGGQAGRPRQMSENERRGQLIAVAGEMFLQKGYRATTMDEIAQCAGMSKKTVYQIFSAKSELFDALLTEWFAPFTIPVETDGRPVREVLVDVLCRLVNFVLCERQISMTRLLIAETSHSEDIALALKRQGIGRGKGALEQWLAAEAAAGTFKIDDPEDAANTLFFTAAGDFLLSLLLRTRPQPTIEDVALRVERAVANFLQQVT
jgi:AcrR family transcriptional regulator